MVLSLQLATIVSSVLLLCSFLVSEGAFSHSDEGSYLANFDTIDRASYSAANDPDSMAPSNMISTCQTKRSTYVPAPNNNYIVDAGGDGTIDSASLSNQCGLSSICIIPSGTKLLMDGNVNVGALIVQGTVEWNDSTQKNLSSFLCAGYVAVESQGSWRMNLQEKYGWIYIKNNGAVHPHLRERAFGGIASNSADNPIVDINGRELTRTWSLLSETLNEGETKIKLLHNPLLMGWRVGDRISVAPTQRDSGGFAEEFRIINIEGNGNIVLNKAAISQFNAEFVPGLNDGQAALKSAEVINLDRNIVITGDDFTHIPCDPSLPEAVAGEQTSVKGCRCSSFRNTCTIGLHQIQMHGGLARIQNTRIEKCGQRGVEGKYCLHFHMLRDKCPECLFKNNAIENSHQRGIIVHGTHLSRVEGNVLYNIRGAGIYIEDGNEMFNDISFNVVICPFPFRHQSLHGCTVPGTSNVIADTSDNQAGIFTRSATNNLIGNRCANSFNGLFLKGGDIGRGPNSYGKVCESAARVGRFVGNTFHGHLRFGTYTLGYNYPKLTDQSISSDGHNMNKALCDGFDDDGNTRGLPVVFKDNLDYQNVFVGHYEAGDIQYQGHHSYDNNNLMYWKETKNFEGGCAAHISSSQFVTGTVALPDIGTFIIEESSFGNGVMFEANHHCNVGTTGLLCMPQYILHNINWLNTDKSKRWVEFQSRNTQSHNANQNHGGIFTLSPSDEGRVMSGERLDNSFFPPGFVSLVSSKFIYLLSLPDNACVLSSSLSSTIGMIYDNGILCKLPLRTLKIYSRGLVSSRAPNLTVEVWFNDQGLLGQGASPNVVQNIGFHQVGGDNRSRKQGYSLPVIPGTNQSYRISLNNGNPIPHDWVIEFSDWVVGNRWSVEHIYLSIPGRNCGINGLVSSHHDRKYIWAGDEFMNERAWGNHGACVQSQEPPPDMPQVDCKNELLLPTECPALCGNSCNGENSYCDCGTATCRCKEGFAGENCSIDLCAAARCGDHGTCAAKYLGSSLPVTSDKACICDLGWTGNLCQFNPCLDDNRSCSNHGICAADGPSKTKCECDNGYSGENCEISCEGVCQGTYPFRCSTKIPNTVAYGCHPSGACHYLSEGYDYPWSGFCTFKSEQVVETCKCGENDNDCETIPCDSNGQCGAPVFNDDFAPCNSVPFGVCMNGLCTEPSLSPFPNPVLQPSPMTTLTLAPSMSLKCGCETCTNKVWEKMAGDHTCGDRIEWLVNSAQSLLELDACRKVSDEFPSICGPSCHPEKCDAAFSPSAVPSVVPSNFPSQATSTFPTHVQTSIPTNSPILLASPCSCKSCNDQALEAVADGHTCGSRISWLVNTQNLVELDACRKVSDEFPSICGSSCHPDQCGKTVSPSEVPSSIPTVLTLSPCGCRACTDQILDTDADGYSCRSRIDWLQNVSGYSERDACIKVSNEEYPEFCGPSCDPLRCPTRRFLRSEK